MLSNLTMSEANIIIHDNEIALQFGLGIGVSAGSFKVACFSRDFQVLCVENACVHFTWNVFRCV